MPRKGRKKLKVDLKKYTQLNVLYLWGFDCGKKIVALYKQFHGHLKLWLNYMYNVYYSSN